MTSGLAAVAVVVADEAAAGEAGAAVVHVVVPRAVVAARAQVLRVAADRGLLHARLPCRDHPAAAHRFDGRAVAPEVVLPVIDHRRAICRRQDGLALAPGIVPAVVTSLTDQQRDQAAE